MGWWRRRGQATRFEWYVRGSFYSQIALSPLLVGFLVQLEVTRLALTVVVVGFVALTAVCLLLVRAGIDAYLGLRPRPTALILTGGGLSAAGAAAAVAAYPHPTPGQPDGPAAAILIMLALTYVAALCAAVRPRITLAVVLACGTGIGLISNGPAAVALVLLLGSVVGAYRVLLWMLGVVRELERARHVQAGLAVAEERLRFARDLHDVVGRTLSVVALKAELAAQLARRGREEAVAEMLEVRRIAQDSLTELRAVVGGYRAADLDVELAGARALLASAGIQCRVIGDGGDLPAALQNTLGWAVREGITNLLRHSEARSCVVTLRCVSDVVTLTMTNNGVTGGQKVVFGGGLIGLTERITTLGGTVSAVRTAPDGFELCVELPLPVGAVAA
ncbi:sensor histidine kinase [Dactylosporangium siamense]|uniref:Histidine kinase n=1 Tax=Dactylosporangium siamense TaxID=685454 RepID=A0A919UGW6_9ACTN|nr:histidine kinase [Dactylosporangium siamense]GIG51776.1 histidine kinase [Dactylosporangium siamense]